MTYMIAIMLAPWLAATGIYHPQVVDRHGRCLAQPGSFDAIYCPAARQHLLITLRNTGHDNNARPHARHTIPSGCQSSVRLKRADRLGSL